MKIWSLLPVGCVLVMASILIFAPTTNNDELMQLQIERTQLEIKILKLECEL